MRIRWLAVSLLTSTTLALVAVAVAQPGGPPVAAPGSAPGEVGGPSGSPAAEPARSPEDVARRAAVVVKVGERAITLGEVEDAINGQSPFLRARFRDPERVREFVNDMVQFELLAAAAEQRGYGNDPQVRQTVNQQAVQQFVRREIDERVTLESVPMADVQAYYDSHQDEFNRDEMRRAAHILVKERSTAAELLGKAKRADTAAFRALAREHSLDDETKLRGGDLRYFTRAGRPPGSHDAPIDPALVAAAFGLRETGDVAPGPVQVGENWSVVRLTGRREAEHRTLEEAERGIRLRLWRERKERAVEDRVAEARQRVAPEVHADLLDAIQLEVPADESGGPPGKGPGAGPPGLPAHPRLDLGTKTPGGPGIQGHLGPPGSGPGRSPHEAAEPGAPAE